LSRSLYVRPAPGGAIVATAGTAAATAGLRYERQWMVLSVLDVLDGEAQYVVPEPDPPAVRDVPDMRGRRIPSPDFLVQEDGTQVWHVVKYGSRPWTIPRLASEGILQACWTMVQADGQFMLDVRADARQLTALANAAHNASSWTSFHHDHVGVAGLEADFERLRRRPTRH
jgi:hypothetical protein